MREPNTDPLPQPPGPAMPRRIRLPRVQFFPLYLALAVNVLFIGAYFWSAGGATTHVRIEAVDGVYRVFVDGKKQIGARCETYDTGPVIVRVFSQNPGALPKPNGLDRLVVTDADSNGILLDDGPSAISNYHWTTVQVTRGVPRPSGAAPGATTS